MDPNKTQIGLPPAADPQPDPRDARGRNAG